MRAIGVVVDGAIARRVHGWRIHFCRVFLPVVGIEVVTTMSESELVSNNAID